MIKLMFVFLVLAIVGCASSSPCPRDENNNCVKTKVDHRDFGN